MRSWRFYDHFRIDTDAPARQTQIGTRTLVLHHDGRDLAAAWQTIREIGDREMLDEAVSDAFPGARVDIQVQPGGLFSLRFHQEGLLRPLSASELSDGTLRYLLLTAALSTPRPPDLMVLNEPESSLHPDLTPALGRLIRKAARNSQVWVISHSTRLAATLEEDPDCNTLVLDKVFSETTLVGQGMLDRPAWHWADYAITLFSVSLSRRDRFAINRSHPLRDHRIVEIGPRVCPARIRIGQLQRAIQRSPESFSKRRCTRGGQHQIGRQPRHRFRQATHRRH